MSSDHHNVNTNPVKFNFLCLVGESMKDVAVGRIIKFLNESINKLHQGISDGNHHEGISVRNPKHSVRFVNVKNLTSLQGIYKLVASCDACFILANHNVFPEVLKDIAPFIIEITPTVLIEYTTTESDSTEINQDSEFAGNKNETNLRPSLIIENVNKAIDINGKTENEDLQLDIVTLLNELEVYIRINKSTKLSTNSSTDKSNSIKPHYIKKKRKTRNSSYKNLLNTNLWTLNELTSAEHSNEPMNNEVLSDLPERYRNFKRSREGKRNIEEILFSSFETKTMINQLQVDALEYTLVNYYELMLSATSS